MTNESRGRNEENIQTTHPQKTSLNRKNGEKEMVQIHRQWKDAHSTTSLHMYPLKRFRVFAFVLYRRVNLNKERNKWARCLRVDALASNAPLPHLGDERRGGTETTGAQCLEVVWISTKERKHLSSKERHQLTYDWFWGKNAIAGAAVPRRHQSDGANEHVNATVRLCGIRVYFTEVTLPQSATCECIFF